MNNYRLEHDIAPDGSLWIIVNEWTFIIYIATVFIIMVASDIVASEFSWGTVKLLLIRPASRIKILFSKYIALLLFAALNFIILFVCSLIIGGVIYGFDSFAATNLVVKDGIVQESSMALDTLRVYLTEGIRSLIIFTLAFMLSAVLRSSSLATTISVLLLMLGEVLMRLVAKYEWAKYILFANTDLSPYFNGSSPLPGMTLQFSVIVLSVYFIVFHVIAFSVFARRDVSV